MISNNDLNKLGFSLTHEIKFAEKNATLPDFMEVKKHPSLIKSSVYIWLSPLPSKMNTYEVLYVGKAGYGTTRRFSQHRGGFRNKNLGSNYSLIHEKLSSGRTILVFGKVADEIDLFGVTISRYSSEEEALCKHLSPLWNRARFPDSSKPKKPVKSNNTNFKEKSSLIYIHNQDAALWYENLKLDDQEKFSRIIRYTESIDFLRETPQKVIGGYTNQPQGYNGIPMIVYGRFTKSGKVAPNGWLLRIPQPTSKTSGLTVFIPYCFSTNTVDPTTIRRHGSNNHEFFYPLDVDHFLNHPEAYVDWEKNDSRAAQNKLLY